MLHIICKTNKQKTIGLIKIIKYWYAKSNRLIYEKI